MLSWWPPLDASKPRCRARRGGTSERPRVGAPGFLRTSGGPALAGPPGREMDEPLALRARDDRALPGGVRLEGLVERELPHDRWAYRPGKRKRERVDLRRSRPIADQRDGVPSGRRPARVVLVRLRRGTRARRCPSDRPRRCPRCPPGRSGTRSGCYPDQAGCASVWPRPGVVSRYVRPVVSDRRPDRHRSRHRRTLDAAHEGDRRPVRCHRRLEVVDAPPLVNVSRTSPLPEALTMYSSKWPVRSLENTMVLPFGDHVGCSSRTADVGREGQGVEAAAVRPDQRTAEEPLVALL